jgi:hypothetical protein
LHNNINNVTIKIAKGYFTVVSGHSPEEGRKEEEY